MKRTIEIEDNLEHDISVVQDAIKEDFLIYIENNPDISDFEEYYQENAVELISSVADALSIYDRTGEYFLYQRIIDEAYENAGLFNEKPNNYIEVAYMCLMEQEGHEFLHELKLQTLDWLENQNRKSDLNDEDIAEGATYRTLKELEEIVEAI
jgi:hypothetical protein